MVALAISRCFRCRDRWVFMETLEEPLEDPKKPGATLTEHFKKMKKCRVSGDPRESQGDWTWRNTERSETSSKEYPLVN